MKFSWPNLSAGGHTKFIFTAFITVSQAVAFNAVPSTNLDISQLGRVALAGDFDGISLYEFEGQNENGFSTNGSQSILSRFPNGAFATMASADAGIRTMCTFTMEDGTMSGVVVGGNFTSLGGIESQGVALFNPDTSSITPLTGLSGQVSAVLCDQSTNTVYVGGSFKGANSTNAIAWVGTAGWTNLPFAGFNGPVTSISQAPNGNIIFGGSFTGLGNATGPTLPDQQVINVSGANITAVSSTATDGFSDPKNIICKTSGTDGTGDTWLLADNTAGSWKAEFGFGFEPTKLRLWNTHQDGRGTQTWRYTAFPINGIMNFTYIDPVTGQNQTCTSECPLSSNTSIPFQDFHFVNVIGMDAFQIDISEFYGSGGGLSGIELFQNDIFSYAINEFNEPICNGIATASTATSTGPWNVSPSLQSNSRYLSASLTAADSPSVTFLPDIKQSGNYSVNMYTPGCLQDRTCTSRGQVNVTGVMASSTTNTGFQTEIFQSNNFDKYDQIYFGYIEASSSSFRPSVTLTPASGQNFANLSIVAQRVGFTLIDSDSGLNSLFEYDPRQAEVNSTDFASSTFDKAGMSLGPGSGVSSLVTADQITFVGGNFSSDSFQNIFSIAGAETKSLVGGGLNGEVLTMFVNQSLYVGGNFSDTSAGGVTGLSNIGAYDIAKDVWNTLGAGVNGRVRSIVPLALNISSDVPETVITLTGDFDEILAFGSNQSVTVTGFAVWVPSRNNWLQNLGSTSIAINGELTSAADIPGGGILFGGSVSSSQLRADGVAALSSTLSPLPIDIQPSSPSTKGLVKRALGNQTINGVVTGVFYESGNRNVTVLGGHFTARATNGSDVSNLAFINGAESDTVTGVETSLSSDSTVLAMAIQGSTLWAGGALSGTANNANVNGIISYSLANMAFENQPPALDGDSVIVNSIAVQPNTENVYVGGSFASAGSLSCPGVCYFATTTSQWNQPGTNFRGVVNAMIWASATSLIVGGSLAVDGDNVSLATFNSKSQTWTAAPGASAIPGPVSALAAANNGASQLWVAGTATNGTVFLMKYDGTLFTSVGQDLGSGTAIRGLEILSVSKNHATSDLVSSNQVLMITGALVLPGFGNASAALFNGTDYLPFVLTNSATGNGGGSISQIFTQERNNFTAGKKRLAKGLIVLIALAIALGLIFFLVLAGIFAERIRRKREGYMPAPTSTYDRQAGISRVPPEQLFSSLGRGGVEKAPMI
ncbi:Polarized growth protein rax2 [Phlyctema vagabunda]|uniref:Polarized growth protein rax2 n=1 Tax=Phlyctema vagabunda TaxID=108571 RepID=A0ABR4PN82_9HELO